MSERRPRAWARQAGEGWGEGVVHVCACVRACPFLSLLLSLDPPRLRGESFLIRSHAAHIGADFYLSIPAWLKALLSIASFSLFPAQI